MTNESSTTIVEPKSPPTSICQDAGAGSQAAGCELKIEQIASRLAKSKSKHEDSSELSSSLHKGSSEYYDKQVKITYKILISQKGVGRPRRMWTGNMRDLKRNGV